MSNATLVVALALSSIAAWYSIIGLTAIFAAAVIPIIIMGSILEVAKVTTTVWLRKYWDRASIIYKFYLVPAVIVLALITSMGIFGFLSKAHTDQNLVSGDVLSKIAVYDEKIKIAKENIDANRKALKQMDEAVDQVMGRSNDEKGADKAVALRRSQAKERTRLQSEIQTEQKTITSLNEERAPIAADVRKVEAEVGPIKYIAALIYGDNPDQNILEKAVRWVIILLVIVFDPLALALVLAANQSKEWDRSIEADKAAMSIVAPDETRPFTPTEVASLDGKPVEEEPMTLSQYAHLEPAIHVPDYEPDDGPLTDEQLKQIQDSVNVLPVEKIERDEGPDYEAVKDPETGKWVKTGPEFIETEGVTRSIRAVEGGYVEVDGALMHSRALHDVTPDILKLAADGPRSPHTSFGPSFPSAAIAGDTFIRVDTVPNRVFKFNGKKWIEINRDLSDTYLTNNDYIKHLVSKLETGEYDPEMLTNQEQDAVAAYLENESKTS